MPSTLQCRLCDALAPEETLGLNGGLCETCAQGYERCEICKELWSELAEDSAGRHICEDCLAAEHKSNNKVQHLDLKAPSPASWSLMEPGKIHHEVLGIVIDNRGEWRSMPMQIGALGFESCLSFWDGSPTEKQLTTATNILRSTKAFRDELAAKLAQVYTDEIRPAYLDGETESESLPELESPEDVWSLIEELNEVHIQNDMDVTLSFQPAFDPNHDWVVRIVDEAFCEIMLDG